MEAHDASTEEAGEWWMKEHEDIWTDWVSDDVAGKVKAGLE